MNFTESEKKWPSSSNRPKDFNMSSFFILVDKTKFNFLIFSISVY